MLMTGIAAFGHHGSGGYDIHNPITLTGVITAVEIVNPHSFVYIDVKNGSGKPEHWALEGSPPFILNRLGIAKDLKPGVVITVTGYAPRNQEILLKALAYSSRAIDDLKTGHVLQAGDMKLSDGITIRYGMGPTSETLK